MSDEPKRQLPVKARRALPLAYVAPPIHAVLEDAQAVASTEIGLMRDAQQDRAAEGKTMGADTAKALGSLVTSVIQAEKAKREFAGEGLEELPDEEVEARLVAALEELRAKKAKS